MRITSGSWNYNGRMLYNGGSWNLTMSCIQSTVSIYLSISNSLPHTST